MIKNLKNKLLGALIGLARATENNESLITNQTNNLLIESLYATSSISNYDTDKIIHLLNLIEEEKKRLIPGCYKCESMCGRNDNYNLDDLENACEIIKNLKLSIILVTQKIANKIHMNNFCDNQNIYNFLYKALFIIGLEDLTDNYLQNIIDEGNAIEKA